VPNEEVKTEITSMANVTEEKGKDRNGKASAKAEKME
jgi:hypothetical protein